MIIIIDMYDFVIRRINVELWHCNGMRHIRPKRNAQQLKTSCIVMLTGSTFDT